MNKNTKAFIVVLGVIVLVILGTTYYLSKRSSVGGLENGKEENLGEVLPADAVLLTAKYAYENGKHVIAGEVDVPTPCTSLDVVANTGEGAGERVNLAFTTINEGDLCAQVIAVRRFKVEFNADENVSITATWNGKAAVLNLIPA